MNLFTPTTAVAVGGLAIARVPYGRYLGWVWPLLAMLTAHLVALRLWAPPYPERRLPASPAS